MAGGGYVAQLEDRATRPGRDTLLSSLTRWLFIGLSLTFLAALLFAPLAVDADSAPSKPVFNLTVGLRDTWAKIEKNSA